MSYVLNELYKVSPGKTYTELYNLAREIGLIDENWKVNMKKISEKEKLLREMGDQVEHDLIYWSKHEVEEEETEESENA